MTRKIAALLSCTKNPRNGGEHRHYRVSPKLRGHRYVIVSTAVVPFSGPETYVFGADEGGKIVDWIELKGSFRGRLDHDEALSRAGYSVFVPVIREGVR